MKAVLFGIVPDDRHPECAPLLDLHALAISNKARRFRQSWGRNSGDCHEMAAAIVTGLWALPNLAAPLPWLWMIGDCPDIGEHSWVECDGWAIDASNGNRRPALVMRADLYREKIAASNIRPHPMYGQRVAK